VIIPYRLGQVEEVSTEKSYLIMMNRIEVDKVAVLQYDYRYNIKVEIFIKKA